MTTIKNIKPLNAEELFDILKKEFATYVDSKIGSGIAPDFAHVHDIINISFPEVKEGMAFTITVSDDEITVETQKDEADYDLTLLESHLIQFLKEKCE